MPREELALLIQATLKKAGYTKPDGDLSLYQAAKSTGVDAKSLSRIVDGTHSPSIETLEKIFNPIGWEVTVSFFPPKKRK